MTVFTNHRFATDLLRLNRRLALVVLALLVIAAVPAANAQTYMFNRADYATNRRRG